MQVYLPKTEHHEGMDSRVVPIFPRLKPFLRQAADEAQRIADDEGRVVEYMIDSYRGRWDGTNLGTRFKTIIKAAGLEVWPKVFNSLRASAETDLIGSHEFDINDIAAWWGHSVEVALKHYSRRRDDDAQAGLKRLAEKTAHAIGTEMCRTSPQETETAHAEMKKARESSDSPDHQWAIQNSNL